MADNRTRLTILIAWLPFLLLFTVSATACNVPVFRYALERWPADYYEVVVFHRGPLTGEDTAAVERLRNGSFDEVPFANYRVQTADLSAGAPPAMLELWETLDSPDLPCIAVRYPESMPMRRSIWTGRLSGDAVNALVDSPLRQEIARRIMDGESAVWVILESGDTTRDEKAVDFLESQLADIEETLTLPGPVDGTYGLSAVDVMGGPEVRVDFSVVRLSRDDPAESIFVAMLMHTEPDLFEYESHPMAFPVYGRGRALFALVGDGITGRNIQMACEFITGACSCEVKALNPGVDILIVADWERAILESWIQDADLPPLIGLSELVEASDVSISSDEHSDSTESEAYAGTAEYGDSGDGSGMKNTGLPDNAGTAAGAGSFPGMLTRSILLAIGVIVAVVTFLTLRVGVLKAGNKSS